jgi:6-phosphogluconolactonase (cycloisomerase 2 family)
VAPSNGVFLPGDQTRLLVTGQDDATMTDFSYDPERGVLTHRGTVRTGAFPAAIAAGRAAVYQADREAGGVSVARTGTGHLAVEQFPTGTWPIDVRVLTSGSREWLVVANRDSGDLSVRFLDHEGTPGGVVFAIAAPGVSSVAAL